jgi:cell division protein FtsN
MRKMIARADKRRGKAPPEDVMVAEAKPQKQKKRAAPAAQPAVEAVAFEAPEQVAPVATEISYYIQLGSFSDGGNAARARDQFAAVWPVQFIELSGASGPVYRVRLGPISNGDDARTALMDAQSSGFGDARLIKTEAVQAALN